MRTTTIARVRNLQRQAKRLTRAADILPDEFPWRKAHTPRSAEIPDHLSRTGTNFDTEWARRYPARLSRALIVEGGWRPIVGYYAKPKRLGTDRLAKLPDSPLIFIANHRSHADTPLLLTSIPEPWRHKLVVGAAADYFFRNRAAGVLSSIGIGAIPIERHRPDRRSADYAAELVSEGWSLLLYPEGGRSEDGWGVPFRAGAAHLAKKCDVPVVPIYISGTRSLLQRGEKWPRQAPSTVVFGEPLVARPDERSRAFNERIQQAVQTLADELETDWWQARLRFHASETPSLEGPDSASWLRAWKQGKRTLYRKNFLSPRKPWSNAPTATQRNTSKATQRNAPTATQRNTPTATQHNAPINTR